MMISVLNTSEKSVKLKQNVTLGIACPNERVFECQDQNSNGLHLLDQGLHSTSDPPQYVSACEEHPSGSHSLLDGGLSRMVSPLKPAFAAEGQDSAGRYLLDQGLHSTSDPPLISCLLVKNILLEAIAC